MLEVKHVTKEYGVKKAIADISATFEAGTITGILGSNGSGKTTLLKCILNLATMQEGSVLLDGEPVHKQYQRVAFISENGSSIPYMNPEQYGKFLQDYYERFVYEEYIELLDQFQVEKDHSIATLSKGQQLKVDLAAGFSMHVDLLILDEPFTTLDIYAKEDTVQFLLKQFHENQIVLLSTHNIEEIETIIDRCIILKEGSIVNAFSMDDLNEQGEDLRSILEQYRPRER